MVKYTGHGMYGLQTILAKELTIWLMIKPKDLEITVYKKLYLKRNGAGWIVTWVRFLAALQRKGGIEIMGCYTNGEEKTLFHL